MVLLALFVLMLAACTAGANPNVDVPTESGLVAGFFLGVWHGFIAPVTFFISLFTENVNIYEVHNSGGWYDFGFVIGAGILLSSGGYGAFRRRYG